MSDPPSLVALHRLLNLCEVQSIRSGSPMPLGAHISGTGANFALFSRNAHGVRLDLFAHCTDSEPTRTFILNPLRNKTGDIWHIWLNGITHGQLYGYRVSGPQAPSEGHRFDPEKLLVDPYATAIGLVPGCTFDAASSPDRPGSSRFDDAGASPKSVITYNNFDWGGDQPLLHSWESTVIYELHLRGYTVHPSSTVLHPGSYCGLSEKIPYLKELGVTAVEIMPVQEFNEYHPERHNPSTGERLKNFWGYDPIGFLAPKASYASRAQCGLQIVEFKEMVRNFHTNDIEVIVDIVLNHTAEGSEHGPTLGLRGIDNSIYYWLAENKRWYRDFTGTGNTINAAHPVVRDLVLDTLRYWVIEMHVDGFRFDLASVLGRDREGRVVPDAPLLERIAEDPILRNTKLIAEAWDAAGAYQVGSFSDQRWAEWNGRYRDDIRRFWRGDEGLVGDFASRICGSTDVFHGSGKGPECSINFITSHDGFTLNDLVSYSRKHNQANGEDNRDGTDENFSANYGVEGESSDPAVEETRARQIRNFLFTLAISRGVPMLQAGDEFRRTQLGNNNAYCQDNEISWIDWRLQQNHPSLVSFVRGMLQIRRLHSALRRMEFYHSEDIHWYTPQGMLPNWSDPHSKSLACRVHGKGGPDLFLMFNADGFAVPFMLPSVPPGQSWRLAVDTARNAGRIYGQGDEERLDDQNRYVLPLRSCALLISG